MDELNSLYDSIKAHWDKLSADEDFLLRYQRDVVGFLMDKDALNEAELRHLQLTLTHLLKSSAPDLLPEVADADMELQRPRPPQSEADWSEDLFDELVQVERIKAPASDPSSSAVKGIVNELIRLGQSTDQR